MNEIENLKHTIDALAIQEALNTAHLKTLTFAFWELSRHLLNKDELSNLQQNYYRTLYEKSAELLNQPDFLYNPSKASFALFDLKSFVNEHLKED